METLKKSVGKAWVRLPGRLLTWVTTESVFRFPPPPTYLDGSDWEPGEDPDSDAEVEEEEDDGGGEGEEEEFGDEDEVSGEEEESGCGRDFDGERESEDEEEGERGKDEKKRKTNGEGEGGYDPKRLQKKRIVQYYLDGSWIW